MGKKQTVETLINEEALLLAKFLRKERKEWISRNILILYKNHDNKKINSYDES